MEFIASFSFLHCQFLPLLTGDPPPPFASFNRRSFYELPLPIPESPFTPVRYSRLPLSFSLSLSLSLRSLLPSLFHNSLAPGSLSRRRVRGHTNCQAGTYELRSTFSLLSLAINLRVF